MIVLASKVDGGHLGLRPVYERREGETMSVNIQHVM